MNALFRRFHQQRVSLAIAGLGLALTLSLAWLQLRWASSIADTEFASLVDDRIGEVQQLYDLALATQQSVNALFHASTEVTQDEFTRFLDSGSGKAPFVAMQYAIRVNAADRTAMDAMFRDVYGVKTSIWERNTDGHPTSATARAEYFPTVLAYPPQAASLRGFDNSSEPRRRAALDLAARTGRPAMTEPLRLMQRPKELGFLAFAPLRNSLEPCITEEICRKSLIGFSVGAYVYADVFRAVLSKSRGDQYDVYVYGTDAADTNPVFVHYSSPKNTNQSLTLEHLRKPTTVWREVIIAQRSLKVAFVSASRQPIWASTETAITLILGLGLTFVLAVTRRRSDRQLAALLESERRRERLISNLPGMVYRCRNDPLWTAEFVSEGIAALTGYPSSDFVDNQKRSFADLIMPDDRDRVWEVVQAAINLRQPFQVEYRIRDTNGNIKWVWEQGCGVYSDSGELQALEGFITDVTSRRHAEEQLAQTQKLEAIGQLTGGMAHDFNNILGVVIGSLDLALMKADEGRLRENINTALKAALRGAEVTKSLLAVARRQSLEPQDVDVNEALRQMMPLVQQTAGAGVDVIVGLCEEEASARVDPGGLSNAILNLVINACDAMSNGGRLVIATHVRNIGIDEPGQAPVLAPGRYIIIEIADDGVGMSADTASRAFEPFFTTKERGKGTGLGLSMVYGFARQSGGLATLYSEPGKGTTVRLYLPSARAPIHSVEPLGSVAEIPRGTEKVLLVDDEQALLGIARDWLQDLGYKVTAVATPIEALDRIRQESWDALVTDIIMPGRTDGIMLAEQASLLQPALKILLTSGFSGKIASRSTIRWRLLEKPYRKAELARVLRKVLDTSETI